MTSAVCFNQTCRPGFMVLAVIIMDGRGLNNKAHHKHLLKTQVMLYWLFVYRRGIPKLYIIVSPVMQGT